MSRFGWAEPLVDRTPEAARPQPWDCSLLWGESRHRASLVWREPQACKALKLRQRSSTLTFYPQYETFLRECGLYTVVSLLGQSPCKELVTVLLERWRPETNTFHLLQGEATIVKISWVKEQFDRLPAGASADVITCYARAYAWVLVGAVLLADRSGDLIPVHLLRLLCESGDAGSFSWGSAVLAWLYKAMGRAAFFTADGYPRGVRWMPIVHRHQHRLSMKLEEIRYALDRATWLPYASRELAYQLEPDDLWRAVTPMICVDSIAWHHPDRCMRQFGRVQRVPQDAEFQGRVEQLLGIDFRASVQDWGALFAEYSLLWEQRGAHIATGEITPDAVSHHFHDEYDEWYRRRTRLAISHDGAQFQGMIDSLEQATMLHDQGDSDPRLMAHVLRSGLAISGSYERLPTRGPHRPRTASRDQTYPPYDGYPIPQRGSGASGADVVDFGGISHTDVRFAPPPYYYFDEAWADPRTYSFDDPPYQPTAPPYQPYVPRDPGASSSYQRPISQPMHGSQPPGSQVFSDDSGFEDWAQRPDADHHVVQTPPYGHMLRDRNTLRPPDTYTDDRPPRRQRGRRQ
ncbi:Serine/threonine-protein phosphatase 7 long form homolog [Linum perenne]